jgi:hypothetical protein
MVHNESGLSLRDGQIWLSLRTALIAWDDIRPTRGFFAREFGGTFIGTDFGLLRRQAMCQAVLLCGREAFTGAQEVKA